MPKMFLQNVQGKCHQMSEEHMEKVWKIWEGLEKMCEKMCGKCPINMWINLWNIIKNVWNMSDFFLEICNKMSE